MSIIDISLLDSITGTPAHGGLCSDYNLCSPKMDYIDLSHWLAVQDPNAHQRNTIKTSSNQVDCTIENYDGYCCLQMQEYFSHSVLVSTGLTYVALCLQIQVSLWKGMFSFHHHRMQMLEQ